MATIVLTVGSAGRNYATFQLAADSIPKNIVASGNTYIIRAYNDSVFSGTARLLNLTGFTTDATHNIRVEAAVGQSFKDNANVLTNALSYNASNGVALSMTCNYEYAIYSNAPYTVIDGLQVMGVNYTASAIWLAGDNSVVSNCLADAKPQVTNSAFVVRMGDASGSSVLSTVVINRQPGSHGLSGGVNTLIENCSVISPADVAGAFGIASYSGVTTIRNTDIFGFSTDVQATTASIGGYNATNLATTTGPTTGTLTGLVAANQFQNIASAATLDLRTKIGSARIDAGTTGSNAISISGLSRPSGAAWDIGAWESAQPATAPFAPTIGSASSIAGAASVSFTANGTGGATITSFLVTSTPGNITGTGTSSPVSVTGLTNGVAYTFTVKAVNSVGTGAASASSNSVTPVAAPTGTITSQPAVDGQSQRFVLTTTGAVSGNFTLTGSAGGVTQTGTFTITANASDFTVTALAAGSYAPTLTVTGAGGVAAVSGTTTFSVLGVSGGGSADATVIVTPVGTGKLKRWDGSAWVSVVGVLKTWNGASWLAII